MYLYISLYLQHTFDALIIILQACCVLVRSSVFRRILQDKPVERQVGVGRHVRPVDVAADVVVERVGYRLVSGRALRRLRRLRHRHSGLEARDGVGLEGPVGGEAGAAAARSRDHLLLDHPRLPLLLLPTLHRRL